MTCSKISVRALGPQWFVETRVVNSNLFHVCILRKVWLCLNDFQLHAKEIRLRVTSEMQIQFGTKKAS